MTSQNRKKLAIIIIYILICSLSLVSILKDNQNTENIKINRFNDSNLFNNLETEEVLSSITNDIQYGNFRGFTENKGQIENAEIYYYMNSKTVDIGFSTNQVFFYSNIDEYRVVYSIFFENSNTIVPYGMDMKTHYINYINSDSSNSHIKSYNEIWYSSIYDGIDLRFYFTGSAIKYDFLVHPGADPNQISIHVSDNVELDLTDSQANILLPK
ncbi:MAG: hypothetical protein OEZ01_17955, partial [Candidatus Heimdallarchaeota archaeon]|nr:hypothetical protein [Candidatus Heimdallarchaeota archaeon]